MNKTISLLPALLLLATPAGRIPAAAPNRPPGPKAEVVSFRGPNRDGSFPGALPGRRPRPRWVFRTGGPIYASPIWVAGSLVVGSGDGHLYAVDGESGAERWRFRTGGAVDGTAAFAAGSLVFESRDGNLYAVDAKTGRERWRLALGVELPFKWGWDFFLSAPAADAGRVFVGSGNGDVLAVDADSGKVAWRFPTGGRVRSSPTVRDGIVYVGSFDGHLYALDAATGEPRWKFATEGVSIDLEKAGFDRRSIQSSPAVTDALVVFGSRDGHLYAVDRATGRERWKFSHEYSWVVSSPAIARDRAIVGSSDGRFVQAVDLESGKEIWRTRTDSNALSSPARAGESVVVGDESGAVLAYDVRTGRELWRFRTRDAVNSSPLVRGGRVYVGSDDGSLYALGADSSEAPAAETSIRAVYYDPRAPFHGFDGDREIRDALTNASYQWLTRREVATFLTARIADRTPSVVVFASDAVPTTLLEADASGTPLVRRYLDAGGKVLWLGPIPFFVTFDSATNQIVQPTVADLSRTRTLFGVELDNLMEGECRAEPTALGRKWGMPAGWWVGQAPLSSGAQGVDALATDSHGHAAAWVKNFGGPEGTGLVFYWGRDRKIPDPGVVRILAEYSGRETPHAAS